MFLGALSPPLAPPAHLGFHDLHLNSLLSPRCRQRLEAWFARLLSLIRQPLLLRSFPPLPTLPPPPPTSVPASLVQYDRPNYTAASSAAPVLLLAILSLPLSLITIVSSSSSRIAMYSLLAVALFGLCSTVSAGGAQKAAPGTSLLPSMHHVDMWSLLRLSSTLKEVRELTISIQDVWTNAGSTHNSSACAWETTNVFARIQNSRM